MKAIYISILINCLFLCSAKTKDIQKIMSKEAKRGSLTAKAGFLNEKIVTEKFNNWKIDSEAQLWLKKMGYNIAKIIKVEAINIPTRINKKKAIAFGIKEENYEISKQYKKSDIQLKINTENGLKVENLSLKKAKEKASFNQIDKRLVAKYQKMWGFDDEIAKILKLFTGEISPEKGKELLNKKTSELRNNKRIFLTELKSEKLVKLKKFFQNNKKKVIQDLIKGRGGLAVQWMLITKNSSDGSSSWLLINDDKVIQHFANGDIRLSPRGSMYLGNVFMQRKGGTPDPTSLQFKIDPIGLFEKIKNQ